MNDQDLELKLLSGSAIEIDGVGFLHPLKLQEISQIGELKYNQFLSAITYKHEPIVIENKQLSPFEVLLVYCYHDQLYKDVFFNALKNIFKEDIHLHEGGFFYLGRLSEKRIIDESKFDQMKAIIKKQNFIKDVELEQEYKPHSDKVAEYIEKMKKIKAKLQKQNAEEGLNLSDIISIISAYSPNINMFNVWDLTVYQLYTLYLRLMMKDNYESQFQLMLQGADIKSSDIKHWATKIK
jgi:hypothetical protein